MRIMKDAALVALICLGVMIGAHARDTSWAGKAQDEMRTPEGPLQAAQWGARDAAAFKKRHPAGIWSGFLAVHKTGVNEWPAHVKRAYLEGARSFLEKPPREKTVRGNTVSKPIWGR